MKNLKVIVLVCSFGLLAACDSGPKVIPVEGAGGSQESSTGVFSEDHSGHNHEEQAPATSKDVHTVLVKEVLPTAKYVYLYVEEDGEEFWVATSKVDVNVGESYFYRQGLLKTNFHSKEYDRTFEKLYLVSQVVPVAHGTNSAAATTKKTSPKSDTPTEVNVEGSVKISELVSNPKKYEGQQIQLSGVVTKVNPNIMNRNWLHLKDGSMDDYDLVVTSEHAIPEGHTVTMTGTVTLNKDFGAGYQYEIIVENGHLVR